jgi:putative ABC transport system substrate-binding protein
VFSNPGNPAHALALRDLKSAAQSLGLELVLVEARSAGEFESAFAQAVRERAQALLVVADSSFDSHRQRMAQLALQHRLPSMHGLRANAEAGGLMSYGPSLAHASHRAASFVDKILKGTRPAELPVEQPTRFELVLNTKTAKALGLAFPASVLVCADSVIE